MASLSAVRPRWRARPLLPPPAAAPYQALPPEALPSREGEGMRRERCEAVTLRRPAQRGGVAGPLRRVPSLLPLRGFIRRRGYKGAGERQRSVGVCCSDFVAPLPVRSA